MHLRRFLLATAAITLSPVAFAAPAQAAAATEFTVSLPAQPLSASLYQLSRTTGVQLVFTEKAVLQVRAQAVSGRHSLPVILDRLLAGTGFAYRFTNANTVRVFRATEAPRPEATALSQDAGAEAPAMLPQQGEAEPEQETVTVTGSRIRREGFEAPVPTTVVSSADLESSGFVELSQAIADIPGVVPGDSNIGIPSGTTQNSGTSTVNLRGLGANRTLVLIDGHRTVSNAANRSVVSLNTIPTDFVDRVEIITGAATAIYGSDAVAGVVNIITESNLKGLRLKARGGTSLGKSGGDELSASATYGARFLDDRGYLLVSANYEQDFGLFASDRLDRAGRSWTFSPGSNSITEPDVSSDILGGRFRGSSYFYDDSGALRTGFVTARDGYNDRPLDTLRVPRDMLSFGAKLTLDVSDAFKPFAQVHFTDLDTEYSRAPIGVRNDTEVIVRDPATGLPLLSPSGAYQRFTIGNISASNPFYRATGIPGTSSISWRRRMAEIGNREFFNDRDTLRIWLGAKGNLSPEWSYEVSYSHGEFWQHQLRTGGVNLLHMQRALNATTAGGNIVCAVNADASSANDDPACVPINIFGVGTISPEAADYVEVDAIFDSHLKQQVAQAYLSGNLFRLPAGPVSTVFGVEYRAEHGSLTTDDETRTGYTTNSGIPGFDDGFNVKEAFAEVSIPLLARQPWAEDLSLDLAGRVSDYSHRNVGTVYSYRAGLTYAPMPELRFRAAYGTAQRAPDLPELYSPPRDDSDSGVTDPCDGVTLTTAGTIAANCRADPGIAAAIAGGAAFDQESTSIASPNGGNLDLKQETATTFTAGFVAEPVHGMNLSVDYYRIKIKDAIDSYNIRIILNQCYGASSGTSDNRFCDLITRSTTTGQLQEVVQLEENLNSILTSGLDVHFSYRFPVNIFDIPGRIDLRADWNHQFEKETVFLGISGFETDYDNGEISSPTDTVTGRIGYEVGPARFQWRTRYIGPTVATLERLADYRAGNPDDYLFYDAYWRHDIYLSIEPKLGDADVRIYAGINNLFDSVGRPVPDGANDFADNGYTSLYGVIGRTFYTGISLKF